MRKLICLFALLSFLVACDDKDAAKPAGESGAPAAATPAKPAAPAVDDGFKAVPNISGIRAQVPDNAKPNGAGGAAGFHSDDESFGFTVMAVSAEQQAKTMDQIKTDTEEIMFKKWLKTEATADGWTLTWESPKLDMSGDEPKEVGILYNFEVRTKLGDKLYKCYGSVPKAENLDAALKTCTTLKAG